VRALIDAALAQGRAILGAHRTELDVLAQGLMVYESLTGEEIAELLAGRTPLREGAAEPTPVSLD
jgi:cell division protease FtsH